MADDLATNNIASRDDVFEMKRFVLVQGRRVVCSSIVNNSMRGELAKRLKGRFMTNPSIAMNRPKRSRGIFV